MKMKSQFAAVGIFLFGALSLSGCATTGMERASKATSKMQTVEGDMKQAVVQVDATNASLQTLMKPDQMDTKKAFDEYAANVSKMEKIGNELEKHDSQMNVQGKEYFAEWEKQGNAYTDPRLREASQERRAELSRLYEQVPKASSGVKPALDKYVSELKQIQNYLSNDLTSKGVDAMTPVAQRAIGEGENLKEAVKPAISAMERAMAEMSQGGKGTAAGGGR